MNLDFNWSYFGDSLWADVGNAMMAWNSPDRSLYWQQDPTIPRTAQGYALSDASANVFLDNYPDGIYEVSYKGTATVDFWGIGQLMEPMVKGADGVTRGRVLVSEDFEHIKDRRQLVMAVSEIDVNDPMSDLEIWSPGYEPGGQIYTNEFLNSLQPFDYIRFLNWSYSNNTTISDWSELRPEGAFPRTNTGYSRIPYEDMIELANEAGKDIWLNVPALANQQFVENLAKLVRERLSPNLKVYIEYSNETWNTGFQQYHQILSLAKSDPLVTAPGELAKVAQESALKAKWVSDVFRAEFGDSFDRVIPVFGGWRVNSNFLKNGLDRIQELYGAPSQYFKTTAIGPYMVMPSGNNGATMSVTKIFDTLNKSFDDLFANVRQNVAVAASYGLPLDMYEGGVNVTFRGASDEKAQAVLNDPRMYDLFKRYIAAWDEAGGRQITYFTLDGPTWGLKSVVTSPGSERWDAVMSSLLQPGDANLDGVVDFADFQVLATNYLQSGAWWEQGDFNHDGVVDETDLSALVSNLDVGSLTVDQAVRVITFTTMGAAALNRGTELGVFAREYASQLEFAGGSNPAGPVARDRVFNGAYSGGGLLTLNGVSFDRGLGVSSASSVEFDLSGNYTTFSSIIGLDDRAGTGKGQATFQIIGDGRVLYVSPVMSGGDAAIPVEVDVRGVARLRLVVTSPTGASQKLPADWAQARFVDARSTSGDAPIQFDWTVVKNGSTIMTTSAESFVFAPADAGDYVVIVRATDRYGNTASRNIASEMRLGGGDSEAVFHNLNTTTQGNWRGSYGAEGRAIAGDSIDPPSYAQVSVRDATVTTWGGSAAANDSRALQRSASSNRVAAAWIGDEFTIDVTITDGLVHQVSLYALDWSSTGRTQRIDVIDAATGKVLDTRTISNFDNGAYLNWSVRRSVRFRVTSLSGDTAAIGGVFFDEEDPRRFLGRDDNTGGTWKGAYGGEGMVIAGDATQLPSGATVSVAGAGVYTWERTTTEVRGAQKATSGRLAAAWVAPRFTMDVAFADDQIHQVSLYALDWKPGNRVQRIDVYDAKTGALLDSQTLSNFKNGAYLSWSVKGSVRFEFTKIEGPNAAISGVFIDGLELSQPFAGTDSISGGTWKGVYGDEGMMIAGDATQLPATAKVSVAGAAINVWENSISDVRGLQKASSSDRLAAVWTSNNFTIDVNLTDGQTHRVSLYALDWPDKGRTQRIDLYDVKTGELLDSRTISGFEDGIYLSWDVKGKVRFELTKIAGPSAVVAGIFIDPVGGSSTTPPPSTTPPNDPPVTDPPPTDPPVTDPPPTDPSTDIPLFAGIDSTTAGTWKGVYGGGGMSIVGDATQLPSGAKVSVTSGIHTWERSTSDVRGLQKASSSDRLAAVWAANNFTIDVTFTDDQTHKVSLYALDWPGKDREQRIDVIDLATGELLDSRTIADFQDGVYISWNVEGKVRFQLTTIKGPNAVIAGVFIDQVDEASTTPPPVTDPPADAPLFAGTDSTTAGTWKGVYGGGGMSIVGDATQLPSGAKVSVTSGIHTWERSTSDVRGLQKAASSDRLAAVWAANNFTIDVTFTDDQTHKVSLYALDWPGKDREQRIDVIDLATGELLDSRTIADFQNGVYISWNVEGKVRFQLTTIKGPNAVIAGVFID